MIFNLMTNHAQTILEKINKLPFNNELAKGSLPKEKFNFYLKQDVLYLNDYARALALVGTKLSNSHHCQTFLQFALDAIYAERNLHLNYLNHNTELEILNTKKMPACFAYTNYLLRMAALAPVELAVASLLPCFWIYWEVGKKIALQVIDINHPYYNWIKFYTSEEFYQSVTAAIIGTNNLDENVDRTIKEMMLQEFIQSSQLELLFWENAYSMYMW